MKPVAVLFARRDSIYKQIPETDVWDIDRDALLWPGDAPIVAHPPCRTWGCLKKQAKAPPDEWKLAPWAVAKVRRWGGVLEHPRGSALWGFCQLPPPGALPDQYGGWFIQVDQFHFGHLAQKATLLYIVGCPPERLPPRPRKEGRPTHVVTNRHGIRWGHPDYRPEIRKDLREASPLPFAEWLCEIARRSQPPRVRIVGL
jgi:hypothetical protein